MDQALTALIYGAIAIVLAWLSARAASLRARGEMAKDFEKNELERQKIATREREALMTSLEEFRTQFAREVIARIERDKEIERQRQELIQRQSEITALQETQTRSEAAIEDLLRAKVALEQELKDVRASLEFQKVHIDRVESERDAARKEVEAKNGELTKANGQIQTLSSDLHTTRLALETTQAALKVTQEELERTRQDLEATNKRVEKLEQKPDTGTLNPAVVPPTDPAAPSEEKSS